MGDESFTEQTRQEFEALLEMAKNDVLESIRKFAQDTERALGLYAEGKLEERDVKTLFEKYLMLAEIEKNSVAIEVQARIQRVVIRLLTLGLSFVVELGKK